MYIVAPAGDIEKFYAAVDAGADEVYMGLQGLGARKNAKNFTVSEYRAAIEYAHERGSRVLLTLNTVMMDNEFEPLFHNLNVLYESGLDVAIIQDLGMFKYLKENFPKLEIHGSTQMTVSNHIEAEYLREMGFKRVVLSRELSYEDIKEIKRNTSIELEIFVSGALCVCYSGKCYMSSFIGARSGNRGMCAQPCRKEYKNSKGEKAFFLSPKDQLMEFKEIQLLKEIGIESIKIEGRMKDSDYVFELTSYYKNLINVNNTEERISNIFNRGYGKGYFYDEKDKIINANYSNSLGKKIGIFSGKEVLLEDKLVFGDGISYISKNYEKLGGCYVSKFNIKDNDKKNRFRSSDINKHREAKKGDTLIIMDAPVGTRYLFKNYNKNIVDTIALEKTNSEKRIEIEANFIGKIDQFPQLELSYTNLYKEKISVKLEAEKRIETASKKDVTCEQVFEKISELGETTFNLRKENFKCDLDNGIFIPMSILKTLKRDASEKLIDKIVESYRRINLNKIPKILVKKENEVKNIVVSAIVNNDEQEKKLKSLGIDKVYKSGVPVYRELNISKASSTGNLAYNLFDIKTKEEKEIVLHWSFNITNSYALGFLDENPKIGTVILSPELSFEKVKQLNKSRVKKSLLIYSKPKVMHIETKISNNDEILSNDKGDIFKVKINSLGNSEIYLEKALDITDRIKEIKTLGIDEVVLEFNSESLQEIEKIINGIRETKDESKETLGYNYWKGVY